MDNTPVSVELEIRAFNDSTEEIASYLDSTTQLDTLDVIISKVEQQLATLRTQLGAMMQTQLDELSDSLRTVQLIKENTTNIKKRFDDVRKNCKESLESLGTNKDIDKLYIARKNVMSVVSQIRFIKDLPERLNVMTARLNQDYTCLKVVYDEWINYFSWMQNLKTQISAISSEEIQAFANEVYSDCFENILALRQLLEDKLWEHIYRCIQLAQSDPAALVRALTIIEKNQRRHLRAKDLHNHGEEVVSWILDDRDWVEECKDRLLAAIQRRCEYAYSQGESMKDKLRIGMQLLGDLDVVRTKLVPCFPPHYNILQFFISEYALIANNQMEYFYENQSLEPGDILVLLEWLDSFCEEVKVWGSDEIPVFVEAKKKLLSTFELVCTIRMNNWFNGILENHENINQTEQGGLISSFPEAIFKLIRTQAELADEHLKDFTLCEAIRIYTAPIQTYIDHYLALLPDFSDRQFCMLINNNNHLRSQIEDLPNILTSELSKEAELVMTTQIEQVSAKLLDLNLTVSHAIADMIIGDIDTARVLETNCFTEDWLNQEEADGILIMTSTYMDYFNDLSVWIESKYFLGAVMIDCLENSVKQYMKCFAQSKMFFDECITIGCRIKTDYDCLLSYFTSDYVMNIMKSNNRDYANADFIAKVLEPIRNLEIYFKSPAEIIVSNNEISEEGYRLLLSLLGGRMMPNGINALVMSRADFSVEDKMLIKEKFAKLNFPVSTQTKA